MDADAASWRPPTLAEERHEERHLLLPLHKGNQITQWRPTASVTGSLVSCLQAALLYTGEDAGVASWLP